jgi:hypothetical protein
MYHPAEAMARSISKPEVTTIILFIIARNHTTQLRSNRKLLCFSVIINHGVEQPWELWGSINYHPATAS